MSVVYKSNSSVECGVPVRILLPVCAFRPEMGVLAPFPARICDVIGELTNQRPSLAQHLHNFSKMAAP